MTVNPHYKYQVCTCLCVGLFLNFSSSLYQSGLLFYLCILMSYDKYLLVSFKGKEYNKSGAGLGRGTGRGTTKRTTIINT